MKNKGDVINGYKVIREITPVGNCVWSFARKDGKDYFIKCFLSPVYPEGGVGGPRVIEKKERQCREFEAVQRKILSLLKDRKSGNLISPVDFFRSGSRYYKITEKVDVSTMDVARIAKLPYDKKEIILRTVAFSLKTLHECSIVHADLKPDNILIKETVSGYYTAKLIDFDGSYFNGEPPSAETIQGDLVYFAPEVTRYIKEESLESKTHLSGQADIFSLGLIFCQYLTGGFPLSVSKENTAHEIANKGGALKIKRDAAAFVPTAVLDLIDRMLLAEPLARPDITTVFEVLKNPDKSKLIIAFAKKASSSEISPLTYEPPVSEEPAPIATGLLKGTLLKKSDK
ncbi:MAG TPA: protein kinase [Cyclobacteriaceae bacterium]|nr:protein kinase [Cyclobacteriaceae bacterium]